MSDRSRCVGTDDSVRFTFFMQLALIPKAVTCWLLCEHFMAFEQPFKLCRLYDNYVLSSVIRDVMIMLHWYSFNLRKLNIGYLLLI